MMSDAAPMIVAVVLFLVIGAVILTPIYLNYRRRKEMYAMMHQERMAAIEKGIEMPALSEDVLGEGVHTRKLAGMTGLRTRSPRRVLLTGLVWLFGGATAFFALQGWQEEIPSRIALIAAAIGLAMVVYYVLVGRKEAAKMEAESTRGQA